MQKLLNNLKNKFAKYESCIDQAFYIFTIFKFDKCTFSTINNMNMFLLLSDGDQDEIVYSDVRVTRAAPQRHH